MSEGGIVWDESKGNFDPVFVNVLIGLIPGAYILLAALYGRISWRSRWRDPIEALEEVYGEMGPVRRVHITNWITWQEVLTTVFAITSIICFLFTMLLLQVEGRDAPTADRWQSLGCLLLCVDACLLISFHRSMRLCPKRGDSRKVSLRIIQFYWLLVVGVSIVRMIWGVREIDDREYNRFWSTLWNFVWIFQPSIHLLCGITGIYLFHQSNFARDDVWGTLRDTFMAPDIPKRPGESDIDVVKRLTTAEPRKETPEFSAGLWKTMSFQWLNPLIRLGNKRMFEYNDFFDCMPNEHPAILFARFDKLWRDRINSGTPIKRWSLANVVYKFTLPETNFSALYKFTYDTLLMIAPLYLDLVVNYLTDRADGNPSATRWRGLIYVGLMALNGVMQTLLLHQYFHNQYQLGLQIRSALSTAVYEKSLRLDRTKATATTENDFSSGKVVNLMAVDAQRLSDLMAYIHIFWSAPYQIIVTCVLLWFQIRWAAFAGLGVMVVSLPITKAIVGRVRKHYRSLLQEKDKRIKKTTETLNGIRAIKYYVWEEARLDAINEIRDVELGYLKRVQSINIINRTLMYGIPSLVAISSFAVYALAMGEPLTPATAFTALALFNNLRFPLVVLPNIVNSITESAVTVERMQNFLLLPSLPPQEFTPYKPGTPALEIKDLTVQINPSTPLIQKISMTIDKKEMVVIVGRTGVGKTAMISTLLGDLAPGGGEMKIRGTMAYCSQTAWIQTGTVQDNIVFGSIFDERKYKRVVEACALESDFQIFPDGDQTEIGERGINLSGGQKQRIALARAVYREADIYIFDDVLSAVDTHVAEHITQQVFLGLLKDKAILLITHRFEVLDHASTILFLHDQVADRFSSVAEASGNALFNDLAAESLRKMEEAEEAEAEEHKQLSPRRDRVASGDGSPHSRTPLSRGSHMEVGSPVLDNAVANAPRTEPGIPPDLVGSSSFLDTRNIAGAAEIDELTDEEEGGGSRGRATSRANSVARSLSAISKRSLSRRRSKESSVQASPVAIAEPVPEEGTKRNRVVLIEEEKMAIGKVGRRIYGAYFKAWGAGTWWMTVWVILCLIVSQGVQVGSNFWLSFWSGHSDPENDGTYISSGWGVGGYTAFNAVSVAFVALTGWILLIGTLRASRQFHSRLLDRTMRAKLFFFDSTPVGRMLSRFAKDINSIDDALPQTLYQYMSNLVQIIGVIVVIAVVLPWMILAIVPMIGIYLFIEKFYVNVVRQFRRIESTLRAPVISNFSESFEGATIIRAFREIGNFRLQHMDKLNANLVSIYISNAANRWLAVRLESLGTLLVVCTALVAVLTAGSLSAALGGLALSYAISCTNGLNWLVRMSGDREANIVAVERLMEYDRDEHCPQEQYQSSLPPDTVETHPGQLEFRGICLQYRPGLPYVLKDVSFVVKAGEKVGVVGRTGAGKSSLLVALLRLTIPQDGQILLNGVETSPMSVSELRSKISIIPQESTLFSGTLRDNLDPFKEKTDEELWETLRRSCLQDWAMGLEDGLQYPIAENGSNLSNGQKQLLCLARVLLKDNRFLLLDEATSAVDPQTDALIQTTIRTEFSQCTILTIAHRIRTVIDYDKIIVMADGRVAEYASPQELLANPHSIFSGMVKAAE